MRIYRHALESIFAMLQLCDLSHVLAVSCSWSAAVRSMAPISAAILGEECRLGPQRGAFRPLPPFAGLVASPLLRHLAAAQIDDFSFWSPPESASLDLLAQHAPNLTSLGCKLSLALAEPLSLPAKLQTLNLKLGREYTATSINGILTTLAALPLLSRIHLGLAALSGKSSVDLSLLAACPSLSDLTLAAFDRCPPCLTHTQADYIRSSLGHLRRLYIGRMEFDVIGQMQAKVLARLLQPPVTAQWRDLGRVPGDAHTGELLVRLPTLTKLELALVEDTSRLDYLSQLPHLVTLDLDCYKFGVPSRSAWYIPADALLASLVQCNALTDLSLHCRFNSAHFSALFAELPLKKLTIRRGGAELQTLRCFAEGPITHSLEELVLRDFALAPAELAHLYTLRRLRALHLDMGYSSRLPDATIDSLSPPIPFFQRSPSCCTKDGT